MFDNRELSEIIDPIVMMRKNFKDALSVWIVNFQPIKIIPGSIKIEL